MKLPNGHQTMVEMAKLRDYCLNPVHDEGKHKARVFASTVGFRVADAERLRDYLLKAAACEDAKLISRTRFGSLYVLDFELKAASSTAVIRSGWIIRAR